LLLIENVNKNYEDRKYPIPTIVFHCSSSKYGGKDEGQVFDIDILKRLSNIKLFYSSYVTLGYLLNFHAI